MTAKKKVKAKPRKKEAGASGAGHGLQLVVLDRGFVYVGEVTTDADWCVIRSARNVRRWGTTEGLGQLALQGPLADTVLDATGTVRAPMRAVIALIACNQAKWKPKT